MSFTLHQTNFVSHHVHGGEIDDIQEIFHSQLLFFTHSRCCLLYIYTYFLKSSIIWYLNTLKHTNTLKLTLVCRWFCIHILDFECTYSMLTHICVILSTQTHTYTMHICSLRPLTHIYTHFMQIYPKGPGIAVHTLAYVIRQKLCWKKLCDTFLCKWKKKMNMMLDSVWNSFSIIGHHSGLLIAFGVNWFTVHWSMYSDSSNFVLKESL